LTAPQARRPHIEQARERAAVFTGTTTMPEPTSEAWAQIRYDYEHTDRPVEDLCAEHGISSGTLRDRMRRWRWTRRRPPISREGPPPLPMAQHEIVSPPHRFAGGGMTYTAPLRNASEMDEGRRSEGESGAAVPHAASSANAEADAASIVPRLQGAVARVLPAIETIIAKIAAGPQHPRELEQAGRALSSLTRTLRELNTLLSQHHASAAIDAANDDDMPGDIDAFRLDLARRIDLFVASRTGAGGGAESQET
jgi:transposase-like protein